MRPLRLRLKGFTSYRDEQQVDMADLEVFAISGPTGAGKSSLLDAMTYALYGTVERVGKHVGQLISQGQPRLAVTLEFAVGKDRYRITRSTPAARGATRVLLERADGEGWRQYGEGADRVRDCDAILRRLIGLDYQAFTRSVLLPQGQFAEFMVGDPRERRDILTELLGLSLFRRMAERAGQIARDAARDGEQSRELLVTEYREVTPPSVREARKVAKGAATRVSALAKAAGRVQGIVERWKESERSIEALITCASEAAALAESVEATALSLRELSEEAVTAGAALRSAAAVARRATREAEKAEQARRTAEERWGGLPRLSGWLARAEALVEARESTDYLRSELGEALQQDGELSSVQKAGEQEAAMAVAATDLARKAEREAEAALEQARHADLVATVSAGLKPGDPCPVCGTALERVARRAGAGALAKAESARRRAERARHGAERGQLAVERALASAQAERRSNADRVKRLVRDLKEREADVARRERELEKALGGALSLDPSASLADRIERLEALLAAEATCREAARNAERVLLAAERERNRAAAAIAEERARLGIEPGGLLARAARAAGDDLAIPSLPTLPERADPTRAVAHATLVAAAMSGLAADLGRVAAQRAELASALEAEAQVAVEGLVRWDGSLSDMTAAIAEARQEAVASAATAQHRAADLAERLARRVQLEEDAQTLQSRAEAFRALAGELRADRLIAFLQAEALQVLAMAGSKRLAILSGGRYRLACREDEFFVVDTWNGDEERSVRTLSGGETFLASLALALALSEQVRSLSVTDRAPLDSLFLDEGFGTLDPESLRIVVEAIEQLGGDGRLVGVITHVAELAEQFPRFEVEKSPRGSRVRLAAA